MPSREDIKRLEAIRDRPKPDARPLPPAPPSVPRTPEVSMPPASEPPPPFRRTKRESLRVARQSLDRAAQNPWVKLVAALLVGGLGGEAHRMLTALGVVSQSDLRRERKKHDEDVARLEKKVLELETAIGAVKTAGGEDHRTLYLTSRYLYFVLPKLGVLVTLPSGMEVRKMDFHPAPVPRGPLGPNDAKPIQPAETFPMTPER